MHNINRLLESVRHRELLQALNKVPVFLQALNKVPDKSIGEKAVQSASKLAREILDSLNEIKNKPVAIEWEHKITSKGRDGSISIITSKATKYAL